jgi:predicted metalloprotease with PDZ domain
VAGALILALPAGLLEGPPSRAAAPIAYRFTFPEPEHHWMEVEASFADVEPAPLELRASQSSPGRYSLHDFAKNVYDVRAFDGEGRELSVTRPDPHGWVVSRHRSSVTVKYKVFGDSVDGTYLGIDRSHAHINMPAAVVWARGLDDRPVALRFVPPAGSGWRAATQLHRGATPFEFTAPNLQYLMDSPVELGPVSVREFSQAGRRFRIAAHHGGGEADLDALVPDIEKIVREEAAIFGEYPSFEPGHYTFLADYLPYASPDAMEHRNSTVMTSPGSIAGSRFAVLDTVAHEFFHVWNVERIRPRSLEPFDFDRANMSGELWLAEGFTEYYAPLVLKRAGLVDVLSMTAALDRLVSAALLSPGRAVRSLEEMSRMAPFTDRGVSIDPTNWSSSIVSYYELGGAVALALDLTLRERSGGRVSLDDFMRAMWRVHGRPGGARQGYVDRPYTSEDAERRLAEVAGDEAFARDFFASFIRGREAPDYARLLAQGGLVLRKRNAGRAWWGDLQLDARDGRVRVSAAPPANTPAYAAGLDVGDEIREMDRSAVRTPSDVMTVVRRRRPGDRITVVFVDRTGRERRSEVVMADDPRLELAPAEATGGALTREQKTFRDRWLGSIAGR